MKLKKIISKNIKLLLRSKVSSLVLVLGPLLIIMLVGVSFSTDTFNLNIGVHSEKYSPLSESLITNLESEEYSVTRYGSSELCKESVLEGQSHACILFPPDMKIDNDNINTISFYVDQSKINLVYLIVSTVKESFGETSTEISRDLAGELVETISYSKTTLESSKKTLDVALEVEDNIIKDSKKTISDLSGLDFDLDISTDTGDLANQTREKLDELLSDSIGLVEEGLETAEEFDDYGGLDVNQSSYLSDLVTGLEELNQTLTDKHNETSKELIDFAEQINSLFEDAEAKMSDAKDTNLDVVNRLKSLKQDSEKLRSDSQEIADNIDSILAKINSIEVTRTESIVSPINTEIVTVTKRTNNLNYLFPSLIVMLIMFIGLLLPSSLIIMEKNSKSFFRTFMTPTKNWMHISATFLTAMALIGLQLIIILFVSYVYFKINIFNSFFLMLLSLIMIMAFFILLGMLIGYIFNSEELAMLAASSLGTVFLLTSGIIFPLESMPKYLLEKAKLNPVVLGSEMFKKSLLSGADFTSIKAPLLNLLLFSAFVIAVILVIKKANNIGFLIKRPTRIKLRKEYVSKQFKFGEREARTLPEFIVSIQNLEEDRFVNLAKQSAFSDWVSLVYKNPLLGRKIIDIRSKKELVDILLEEMKKTNIPKR